MINMLSEEERTKELEDFNIEIKRNLNAKRVEFGIEKTQINDYLKEIEKQYTFSAFNCKDQSLISANIRILEIELEKIKSDLFDCAFQKNDVGVKIKHILAEIKVFAKFADELCLNLSTAKAINSKIVQKMQSYNKISSENTAIEQYKEFLIMEQDKNNKTFNELLNAKQINMNDLKNRFKDANDKLLLLNKEKNRG